MHRNELVEFFEIDNAHARCGKLDADDHGREASDQEHRQERDTVLDADDLVIGGELEVAPPGAICTDLWSLANPLASEGLDATDARQPTDESEDESEDNRYLICSVSTTDSECQRNTQHVSDDAENKGSYEILHQVDSFMFRLRASTERFDVLVEFRIADNTNRNGHRRVTCATEFCTLDS